MFNQFQHLLLEVSKFRQTLLKTKQLHAFVVKTHLTYDPFYITRIVRLYALNNDILSARNLFNGTPLKTIYLWNSIIRAYARAHKFSDAFLLFQQMLNEGETQPDNFTYACILCACSEKIDIERLRVVHGGLVVSGMGVDSICGSALVTAYAKVGLIDDASNVFNRITEPDLVLWNSIILAYASCGNSEKGLYMFNMMRRMGKKPDGYSLVAVMSGLMDFVMSEIIQGIHGFCLKTGFDSCTHVGSVLVSIYSGFKCTSSAHNVFESLCQPDLVTWTALITVFSQSGEYRKALLFFKKMNVQCIKADPILIASLLTATAQLAIVGPGLEIHGYAVRHNFNSQIMVCSALIDMYSKCGFLALGFQVFNNTHTRNIVCYNIMISSLGFYGLAYEACKMFNELVEKGLKPDKSTFSAILCACAHAGLVNEGCEIFKRMRDEFEIEAETEHYVYMVKLLGMAGQLEEAYDLVMLLPEPVDSGVWGALLSCCNVHGNSVMAEVVAERIFENEPRKFNYKVMLSNAFASDGRWDDVMKLRDYTIGGTAKLPGVSWIGMNRK